jgi:hypothetical protein
MQYEVPPEVPSGRKEKPPRRAAYFVAREPNRAFYFLPLRFAQRLFITSVIILDRSAGVFFDQR